MVFIVHFAAIPLVQKAAPGFLPERPILYNIIVYQKQHLSTLCSMSFQIVLQLAILQIHAAINPSSIIDNRVIESYCSLLYFSFSSYIIYTWFFVGFISRSHIPIIYPGFPGGSLQKRLPPYILAAMSVPWVTNHMPRDIIRPPRWWYGPAGIYTVLPCHGLVA